MSVSSAGDTARHGSGEAGDAANTDSLQGSNTRFQNKAPTWECPVCREKTHTRVSHTQAQFKVKRINSRQNPRSSVMCHHHPLSSGGKQNTNELDVLRLATTPDWRHIKMLKKRKIETRSLSKEKTGQASYSYQSKSITSVCREHSRCGWQSASDVWQE